MANKFNRETLKGLTKTNGDHFLSNKFGLEIDGVIVNGVHKVDGVEFECEVVEYNDGDDIQTHCRPGLFRPGRIVVERDQGNDKAFFTWRKEVVDGKTDRRSISITFHNDKGDEAKRINFFHCFPTRWTRSTMSSHESGIAREILEIGFEEMKMG